MDSIRCKNHAILLTNHTDWVIDSGYKHPSAYKQLLGLLAKVKMLDSGTVLVSVDLCRFCVLSLHREVGGVRQYTQ